jgi:iron complex transport system substrate-binding protein
MPIRALRSGLLSLTLLGLLLPLAQAQHTVVDSAGRPVAVPAEIKRVFAAGPPASIFLYVLAPDRLLGWPRGLRADEQSFIAAPYRELPELGRLTGRGDTANLEVILAARPDIIFDFGSLAPTYVSLADRMQQQTSVPYLLIDGTFANTAASLRLLGDILDVAARAEQLARYTEQQLRAVDQVLAKVPLAQRPRVYFARGPDGLETGVRGSINTEIIERVGAVNVAEAPSQEGLARVSVEQLLSWNPDTIVTLEEAFYASVWQDPRWQNVAAVQQGRVFLAPRLPFGWVDRPPSVNRLIGLQWLARLFYPAHFQDDLRTVTRKFYRLFYHVELSDVELNTLLAKAAGNR